MERKFSDPSSWCPLIESVHLIWGPLNTGFTEVTGINGKGCSLTRKVGLIPRYEIHSLPFEDLGHSLQRESLNQREENYKKAGMFFFYQCL